MKFEDLDEVEEYFLIHLGDNPHFQYTGPDLRVINDLAAHKLCIYAGSMRYELTEEGKLFLKKIRAIRGSEETTEEIPATQEG